MRKVNAWLTVAIMALLVVHGIAGAYQMAGVLQGGNTVLKILTFIMIGCVAVHAVIGVALTLDTIKASKQSGKFYIRENLGFIVKRVSGFAIIIFVAAHVVIFSGYGDGALYRLNLFEGPQLALSICLVISLAVHILCSVRPLFISLGLNNKERRRDVVIIAAVIIAFALIMFIVYYLRWNVDWEWNLKLR